MSRINGIKQLIRCVDDSNRPDDIPSSKWIRKGEIYTIKEVGHSKSQAIPYYVLEEIDVTGCGMYGGFSVHRFEAV
jgi:hypothetical protein